MKAACGARAGARPQWPKTRAFLLRGIALQAEVPTVAPIRVLVVDDIPEILAVVERLVRSALRDVRVATEADARAALRRVHEERFDVVIADLRMPHVNGLKVLAAARERDPGTRRVLMSGHIEPTVDARYLHAFGLDGFLQKPFDAPEVVRFLRLLVLQHEAHPEVIDALTEPAG